MSTDARSKWRVLVFIFLIGLILYLDRLNISVAGPAIARESGFSDLKLGIIFSAFTVGYGFFQIPDGWLGDRFGHKRILILALVWWSLFTALTPWAGKGFLATLMGALPAICLARFLIGAGAAATYPCSSGLIGTWFKPHERTRASGVMLAGVGLGSAATPPLIAWIVRNGGWRSAFYVSGALGLVFAIIFHYLIGDAPAQNGLAEERPIAPQAAPHRNPSGPETNRKKQGIDWGELFANRSLWALTLSDFSLSYVVYIFYFWIYLYLVNVRGFSVVRASLFTSLPFLAMGISAPLGGWVSDGLIPRLGKVKARRLVAMSGLMPCAVFLFAGASVGNAYWAIACLGLAAGFLYLSVSCYWATAIEIVPGHPATVSGIMSMGGNLAGTVSPILTPWMAAQYGWVAALGLAAGFALLAAFLWMFIGASERIPERDGAEEQRTFRLSP